MRGGLGLADLFDVELQLLRDRDRSRDDLRRRDRRIGLAIRADERAGPDERRALLRDWAEAVRKEAGEESAGERVVRVYRALGWLLVLFGLTSGAGTAATVLAYSGTRPVNVVHFLAIFVGLQVILLLLFIFSSTLWRLRDRLPAIEGVYALLRLLFEGLGNLFERRLSAERRGMLRAARGRLKSSHVIYGDAEHWLLVSLAQRFGLSFNFGALATCLYLVAFSDLAFAWQTTLSWSAEGFHRLISVIAAPWSWAYPDGLPTLEIVRASRYFRLDGSFGQVATPAAAHAALLGQWWRFLVLALLVYGLLPRLILSLVSRARVRKALVGIRLDHGEIASLLDRLTSPLVSTQAPVPEGGPAPPPERAASATSVAVPERGGPAAVVLWGGVPIDASEAGALIARRFGWRVGALEEGGAGEVRHDAEVIETLAAGGGGPDAPIVVVAEAFEAPTRDVRSFLARLRQAVGAERSLVVSLVGADGPGGRSGPSSDDRRVWERHLAGLGDPYLRVEALVEDA